MTTPKEETLEQIAERVVDENLDTYHYSATRRDLIAGFISALRNERERGGLICDKEARDWTDLARNYKALDPMRNSCLSRAEMANELAAAIRGGTE